MVGVLRFAAALETAGDALARPAGQSSARWLVLAAIEDEPHSVASIARMLSRARQSVQRVADALVSDDLARYVPNPVHRRAKLLELTETGIGALHTIQIAQVEWAQQMARGSNPAELDAIREALVVLEHRLPAWVPEQATGSALDLRRS